MLHSHKKKFHLKINPRWKLAQKVDTFLEELSVPQRRYRVWKGKNGFFLWGRLMIGSHGSQLFLSIALITINWLAAYMLLVAPYFQSVLMYQLGLYFWTANVVLLLLTSFVEPGIQPRRATHSQQQSAVHQEGMVLKSSYCQTCSIVRNERTKHC